MTSDVVAGTGVDVSGSNENVTVGAAGVDSEWAKVCATLGSMVKPEIRTWLE